MESFYQNKVSMRSGKSIGVLLVAMIALTCIPRISQGADFADLFRQGLDAEDAGNLDQALSLFSDAIKVHQHSAQAWAKRGEIYLKKGDPSAAIKDLTQAIKLDPAFAAAYIRLGFAYNAINQYDRAIEALDVGAKLDPNSAEALNTRGFSYNGKNEYEKAIRDFDRAIRLNANDARYYNNRGFALNGEHKYTKAIEDFDRAIHLDPKNAMYYNNRGVAYLRQKQFDKALENFDKAIELNSKFDSAYHNRGMALSGKGRHEKAVEEFSKVIEINPQATVLYKDRGTAYRKLGEYELAQKDFEKALELDKNFAPAYGALGLLHALAPQPPIHNPNQAIKLAQKAVTLTGGTSPDMLENLAEVLFALGQPAVAISTLTKALAMDPENREYQELLTKWKGSAPASTIARERETTQRKPFDTLWQAVTRVGDSAGSLRPTSHLFENGMTSQKKTLDEYVGYVVRFSGKAPGGTLRETMLDRFRKAFSLLPAEVADLFLSNSRHLAITVMPDRDFPFGMSTRTEGRAGSRQYTITVYHEHGDWPEDRFIGALLRELGHVVAQRPPEDEWPVARAERAKFKEQLENHADAMVWRWGLRHFNMIYITATFPEHWVEPILAGIGKALLEEPEYDA